MSTPLAVAAGVLRDRTGAVLLARRPVHKQHGGLWEFPGGKLEADEDGASALRRELAEELGFAQGEPVELGVVDTSAVQMQVFAVQAERDQVHAREGQTLRWVAVHELHRYPMPPADRPIARSLALSPIYAISPTLADQPGRTLAQQQQHWQTAIDAALERGMRLLALRDRSLSPTTLAALARWFVPRCAAAGALSVLHGEPYWAAEWGFAGVHRHRAALAVLTPACAAGLWQLGSCHNAAELRQAQHLDAVTISPVCATRSHPEATPLGWSGLQALTTRFPCNDFSLEPVIYALGGLKPSDLPVARQFGALGVAGIAHFVPYSHKPTAAAHNTSH